MSNKILNLIFKATDKASPTLDKLQGASGQSGVGGLTDSLKKMINPATLAMGAVVGLGTAAVGAMQAWQDYTLEVANFNAMIDGTIEETSVLIELSKDYDVTMDTMLAAMRSLAASGIEPNIEGLIQLRAQLDATASASDRLKLAQQLIGEQGIKQILPMLDELNDEQLRDYVNNLTEAEKITEEMVETAREQRKAISDLKDAWEGFSLSLGAEVSTALMDTLFWLKIATGATEEQAEGIRTVRRENFGDIIADWRKRYEELHPEIDTSTRSLQGYVDTAKELIEVTEALVGPTTYLGVAEMILADGFSIAALGAWEEVNALVALLAAQKALAGNLPAMADVMFQMGGMWSEIPIGDRPQVGAPSAPPLTGGGWGPWQLDALGRRYRYNSITGGYEMGYQTGGSFEIGGSGGPDSQDVSFKGTPGEQVNISKEDTMGELLLLMRRMPTMIADAVERVV